MSKIDDLIKLKELLDLKKKIHLLGKHNTIKYNELLDWATNNYWYLGTSRIDKDHVSVEEYYKSMKNNTYLLQGKYYFINKYFGIQYVYLCNALYSRNTGSEVQIDEDFNNIIKLVTKKYPSIRFILFVEYKNTFVIEDIVAENHHHFYEMLEFAKSVGLNVNGCLTLKIDSKTPFTKEYYGLIHNSIKKPDGFYVNGMICLRDDNMIREVIDLKPKELCCIQYIRLEKIADNLWLPYAITFNGDILKISGFKSLVDSRLYVGSFVYVIKYKNVLLLPDNNKQDKQMSRNDYIRKILEYFNNEYFTMGNYMIKTGTTEAGQLHTETGILMPYKNMEDLERKLKDKDFTHKLRHKSLFDLSCDYFLHDRDKVVRLINEMDFQIDEDNKIKKFDLKSKSLIKSDKVLEDIYMKFHQFVIVFNSLSTAKSILNKHSIE
ncbi:DNA polymerase processivity factor [Finch poxvirus]|uniref:DNA polymerase processivity factor n=2 Tax=unclassified Avipoxvirus TaxID=336487 RepID=A0AAT9UQW3_9POXV|nr:DNA polymerase processivity factor [Finch poxvirus]UOX38908.1 DNA polymerase processivity factor [Finch poxvirus]